MSDLPERDRLGLKEVFKDLDLTDMKQVVRDVAGKICGEINRRDALGDAKNGHFTEHDRESWKRVKPTKPILVEC